MSRFNTFLHHTGERLALPKATRSLILVEIASDLEDLFQHYLQQGSSEEEAAALAEEKVDMSDEALAELVRIHSEARGWTDRMSRRPQPFWERFAMAVIVLFFLVTAGMEHGLNPREHLTGFIWPIGAILLALVVTFVVQLVRMSDHPNPRRVRDGLAAPLFLGAASVVLGFLGAGINMYRSLVAMVMDPQHAAPVFAKAILDNTTTLSLALLVALIAGVVWFVLAGRATRLEDDAARVYLEVK
jgi:hypothetical protein